LGAGANRIALALPCACSKCDATGDVRVRWRRPAAAALALETDSPDTANAAFASAVVDDAPIATGAEAAARGGVAEIAAFALDDVADSLACIASDSSDRRIVSRFVTRLVLATLACSDRFAVVNLWKKKKDLSRTKKKQENCAGDKESTNCSNCQIVKLKINTE
jgi:hypothetical protein